MRPDAIYKEITIQATAEHVWQWVGTERGLRQWWKMELELEPKIGGRCVEYGFLHGTPYQLEGVVTIYDPPRQLAFVLAGKQPGGDLPTRMNIRITLEEVSGATVVRVVHQLSAALAPTWSPQPPEIVVPHPIRPQPTLLNQLPESIRVQQSRERATPSRIDAGVAPMDAVLHNLYGSWWAGRLQSLQEVAEANLQLA